MKKGIFLASLLGLVACCSPGYLLRAAWEEGGILWRKERLEQLIDDPKTDPELRRRFALVLEVREFCVKQGLNPGGSYTEYSRIDRDVLVWVLSAGKKLVLEEYNWWFPIVGNVPYKGFFDKEDAVAEAEKLERKGYDSYLRTSPAFSTLGWFDDPLLSTMLTVDDVDLVNTVIHEILHNTIWLGESVTFNESLANFVGGKGAEIFYLERGDKEKAKIAADRLHDELLYARFLAKAVTELEQFYASKPDLPEREKEFARLISDWKSTIPSLRNGNYNKGEYKLNNAIILAQRVYFDRLWLFESLYSKAGSISSMVEKLKSLKSSARREGWDPYAELELLLR